MGLAEMMTIAMLVISLPEDWLIYSVQEVCSRTPKAEVQQFDIFFLVMAQSAKPY
jgi:F0F1-type ATP synthase membrane subunit c/vacuolar-type H+-ATPase subunit K